jgi:WD40 repeat protein
MAQKLKRVVIGVVVLVAFATSAVLVGPAAASRAETGPERLQRSLEPEALLTSTVAPGVVGTPTPARPSPVIYTSDGNPCVRPMVGRGGAGYEPPFPELTAGRAVQLKLEGHAGPVYFASFSPDGKQIVTSAGGQVRLWDATTGRKRLTLPTNKRLGSPAFSPDGQTIAVAADDGTVRLYSTATGGEKFVLPDATGKTFTFSWVPEWSVAFSPDGRTIATAKHEVAILWDAESGRKLRELAGKPVPLADDPIEGTAFGHGSGIYSVIFSPNGQALLTAGDDWTVRLWDVATGKHLRCFEPLKEEMGSWFTSAVFSPDGRTIAASYAESHPSVSTGIYLWDALSGRTIRTFREPHNGKDVNSVAFSPQGGTILSAGDDRTARLWDVRTGKLTGLLSHPKYVHCARFSPNGTQAVTGQGEDEAVSPFNAAWLWNLRHNDVSLAASAMEMFNAGKQAVYLGDLKTAAEKFKQAQAINPSRDYGLEAAGKNLMLTEMGYQFRSLIGKGQVAQAQMLEQQAKELLHPGQRDAEPLDKFCRMGALIGDAAAVLDFCDVSVQMASEDEPRALYRESRAIARALTGDFAGAAEDLRYAIAHYEDAWWIGYPWYNNQSDAAAQRRSEIWLAQLQAGRNPFDRTTLQMLLQETVL